MYAVVSCERGVNIIGQIPRPIPVHRCCSSAMYLACAPDRQETPQARDSDLGFTKVPSFPSQASCPRARPVWHDPVSGGG